jgi:hypothetical protein
MAAISGGARIRSWGRDETETVTRRVLRPAADAEAPELPIGQPMPLSVGGSLRLDAPFVNEIRGSVGGWRTRGRLVGRGLRLAHHARVEIVLAPWSDDVCELQLAPRSHRLHHWGERRRRRYWRLAHAAADEVRPLLER